MGYNFNIFTIKLFSLRNCAGKEKQSHKCHLCEKSFSVKDSLTSHIKHIHEKILNHNSITVIIKHTLASISGSSTFFDYDKSIPKFLFFFIFLFTLLRDNLEFNII